MNINNIKRQTTIAASVIAISLTAANTGIVYAGTTINGTQSQGRLLQGQQLQGRLLQGQQLQGRTLNGVDVQKLDIHAGKLGTQVFNDVSAKNGQLIINIK